MAPKPRLTETGLSGVVCRLPGTDPANAPQMQQARRARGHIPDKARAIARPTVDTGKQKVEAVAGRYRATAMAPQPGQV